MLVALVAIIAIMYVGVPLILRRAPLMQEILAEKRNMRR